MSKEIRPNRERILQIRFERKAEKFFDKNSTGKDEVNELIIKAVKKLSGHNNGNIDLRQLKGEWKGYLRIRKNNLRIILKLLKMKT